MVKNCVLSEFSTSYLLQKFPCDSFCREENIPRCSAGVLSIIWLSWAKDKSNWKGNYRISVPIFVKAKREKKYAAKNREMVSYEGSGKS